MWKESKSPFLHPDDLACNARVRPYAAQVVDRLESVAAQAVDKGMQSTQYAGDAAFVFYSQKPLTAVGARPHWSSGSRPVEIFVDPIDMGTEYSITQASPNDRYFEEHMRVTVTKPTNGQRNGFDLQYYPAGTASSMDQYGHYSQYDKLNVDLNCDEIRELTLSLKQVETDLKQFTF